MSLNLACYNYPMQRLRIMKIVPPGILAISLMVVYLITMAPGVTWANSGADGGDLITAAATGGQRTPLDILSTCWLPAFFKPFRSDLWHSGRI